MRADLLSAAASVNWAASNFRCLDDRLQNWTRQNVRLAVKQTPAEHPNNVIVAEEKEPLPLEFTAEVGAYINAIRSSLDILAASIADRYAVNVRDKEVYFPVAPDRDKFLKGSYKGAQFVQALPEAPRAIIQSLKPYGGGNDLLWLLHRLDIARKHFRLLIVESNPKSFHITGFGLDKYFTRVSTGWACNPGETILGLLAKGAPRFEMEYSGYVGLNEPGPLARKPVVTALEKFAEVAKSIIGLFDD